jgi:hypothetical protein
MVNMGMGNHNKIYLNGFININIPTASFNFGAADEVCGTPKIKTAMKIKRQHLFIASFPINADNGLAKLFATIPRNIWPDKL